MFVYSGDCKICECGNKTIFYDMNGFPLFTGDIVLIVVFKDKSGNIDYLSSKSLSCVVSDDYISYSNGEHKENKEQHEPFVMGLSKCVAEIVDEVTCFTSMDTFSYFKILKIKDHTDVIAGENWKSFGFNYRNN